MSWWGKGIGALLLFSVVIISCEEEENLLGFKSPDENFKVVYKEFSLPTSVLRVDSIATSNGSSGAVRILAGAYNDALFGRGTATAYSQYFPISFPAIPETATFVDISMTLIFDNYHFGSQAATNQSYEVRELTDSLVNTTPYFTTSSTPVSSTVIGSSSHHVDPVLLDKIFTDNNADQNVQNDVYDSLTVGLSQDFGQRLFEAVRATDSTSIATYRNFTRWRKIFKGIAVIATSADKVVGFDPANADTRLTLHYMDGATKKEIKLTLSPVVGMMTYTGMTFDRSGTPFSTMTEVYTEYDPADGKRYVQSGSGFVTKIEFKDVYDYFGEIAVKSLNVAELSVGTDKQTTAPFGFYIRAVGPDNKPVLGLAKGINEAYDSIYYPDPVFQSKHYIFSNSAPRADIVGDDGKLFVLSQKADTDPPIYKGYITNFLQQELTLAPADQLADFTMIPYAPEFSKSLNGFYFHKDSIKLKLYYTTLNQEE